MPRKRNACKSNPVSWQFCAFRLGTSVAAHPLEYAKILMQIGYEPIPPTKTTGWFGRRTAFALPNIFQYVAHIKRVDGFTGCWRGVGPKFIANVFSGITYQRVYDDLKPYVGRYIKKKSSEEESEEEEEDEGKDRWDIYFVDAIRDFIARAAAIIVSHPLHVVALRTMAQFVGRETKYTGLFVGIKSVYSESGIFGYFYGLTPRLFGEICTVALTTTATYALNAYLVEDTDVRSYVNPLIQFMSGAFMYPYQVVSSCVAISASGLMAAEPPYMPLYTGWRDCHAHLRYTNQLKRGSSMFWRFYTGPYVIIGSDIKMKPANFIEESRRLFRK